MKTYKQFSEDMKKNFQTFLNNPETQDLIGRIKEKINIMRSRLQQ